MPDPQQAQDQGPWTQYQPPPPASTEEGPWAKYAKTPTATEEKPKTQFEQNIESTKGKGLWEGLKSSLPSVGSMARRAILGGFDPVSDFETIKGLGQTPENIKAGAASAREATPQDPTHPWLNKLNQLTSGLFGGAAGAVAPLVGVNPQSQRQRALAGDTSGIVGENVVPTAMALAPVAHEALRNVTDANPGPVTRTAVRVAKGAAEPYTIGMTGEAMLKKGLSPYAKQTGYDAAVKQAGDEIVKYHQATPIKSVQDLHEAIPEIKDQIADQVMNPAGQRHATENLPDARLVKVKQAANDSLSPFAQKVGRTLPPDVADFLKDLDKAHTIEDLIGKSASDRGGALGEVNGKLDSYFAKYPSARRADLMKNPETAGWEAIRRSLRDEVLGHLEDQGETSVRDARKTWGALEELGKTTERRINVNDRAKPMSLSRILGLVGAVPTGGLSVAAGELANYLNKPDVLVRRGIERMSKQAVRSAQANPPAGAPSTLPPPSRPALPAPTPQINTAVAQRAVRAVNGPRPTASTEIPARGTPERRTAENRVIGSAVIDQLYGELRKATTPKDRARIQRNISDLQEQRQ